MREREEVFDHFINAVINTLNADEIYDGAGRLLLAKHLLLSEEYISNLEFLGFPGIYIDDEFTQGIEIQQVLNPQVRSQALKVVHDMFAFDVASDAEEDMPVSEIKIQKTIERIVENILSLQSLIP